VTNDKKPAIGVFGAGWVGLVTGACFAELGHQVIVRDVVPERIEALQDGRLPFHEPGLGELVERNRGRLTFTTGLDDLVSAPIMFVCVGTPPTYSGDADLSAVWTVVDQLPPLEEHAILVMKSTVPVGTGEKVRAALEARGLSHIGYVSNPEFLAEGGAVEDFMSPDRVVVGSFAQADGDRVASLYEGLDSPIVRADVASAEMIKLAANAFLATRISFINEIANVCEVTGADVVKVAEGVGLDHRLGPHFLRAGVGFGGSCFPKDTNALKQLASNSGYHFQLLSAVIEVNELQKRRVINKLQKYLGRLRGKRIALLGLAFKANTDDMREAPSVVLASRLLAEGAEVRAYDPVAKPGDLVRGVTLCESALEAVQDADAAVIVTDWDEFRSLASPEVRAAMRRPLIVDGRNLLDPEAARSAGFDYEGIGRASSPLSALPETSEPASGNLPSEATGQTGSAENAEHFSRE
jgi:UDPglucose 6-dehydrogenase